MPAAARSAGACARAKALDASRTIIHFYSLSADKATDRHWRTDGRTETERQPCHYANSIHTSPRWGAEGYSSSLIPATPRPTHSGRDSMGRGHWVITWGPEAYTNWPIRRRRRYVIETRSYSSVSRNCRPIQCGRWRDIASRLKNTFASQMTRKQQKTRE